VDNVLNLFQFIRPVQLDIDQQIFVYTSQIEILKTILDENILNASTFYHQDSSYRLSQLVGHLFKCDRLDIILVILHYNEYNENALQACWNDPKFVSVLTGNPKRRRLFYSLLDDKSIGTCLALNTDLLFILLQKKECKLMKKLFRLSPSLIHRLDADGNDPLLYICLKVRGCRHRIIEYLIKIERDSQRRNVKNENVFDALQLRRNRDLVKNLIQHNIIQIDHDSERIKVISVKQSK
jgi:hypothetical protein